MRFDATVPIHRQPSLAVRFGGPWPAACLGGLHAWFMYGVNGCWCKWCDRFVVRLDGRRQYKGRHRRV